jgi:hypothetical protein
VGDQVEEVLSRLAPVQLMAWTFPCRIISASETPSSAVLMAPASETSIAPPPSTRRTYPSACLNDDGRVEVPVVPLHEVADRPLASHDASLRAA